MALFIQTALVITVLCSSGLGVFIFTRKILSHQRTLLVIHFFSIATWALSTLVVLQKGLDLAVKVTFASAIILALSKYYFILSFPDTKTMKTWRSYIPLALTIPIFAVVFLNNTYYTHFLSIEGYYVLIENGPLSNIYMLFISALLIYPIIDLYKKMRSAEYVPQIQEQIKFLFLGVSFFFILGLTTNSILPVVFDIHQLNGLGPSLSLILAGFILYIISRYNFLGLSLVIQRGLIYSVLATVIVGVYLSFLFLLEPLFQQPFPFSPMLSGILTSFVGIFSVPYIDKYLRKKTDRFFFKDTYNYSDTLQHISAVLNTTIEIEKIKSQVAESLQHSLKASKVTFDLHVDPTRNEYAHTNDTVIVPLMSSKKHVGNLLVHAKRSGDSYTTQDLQLLKTLSYNLGMALERALLHKELQDHAKQLEEKVRLRTAELHQAYAEQQIMISNIAHGLQTPLTIIESEMENLKINHHTPKQLQPLRRSLASVSIFIADLLKLARLESKTDTFKLEPCDVHALIEDTVSYVSLLSTDQGVSLQYTCHSTAHILADTKKIEEVLLALISNALKYKNPTRKNALSINLDTDDSSVIISISDSGIGIPKEAIPKIFDRFYRVQTEATSAINGSGLGLPIAKAIIRKHNGDLSVQSVVGVGTTFIITIPRA